MTKDEARDITKNTYKLVKLKKSPKVEHHEFGTMQISVIIRDVPIVYVHPSNELGDWPFNMSGVVKLPFVGHPGYTYWAIRLKNVIKGGILIDPGKPYILVGHSFGGGVVCRYMEMWGEDDARCLAATTTGTPVTSSYLRIKKLEKLWIFHKEDDPVRLSAIMYLYKLARGHRVKLPKTKEQNPIHGHYLDAYLSVL